MASAKKRWKTANRDKISAQGKEWAAANVDRRRDTKLRREYGVTLDEVNLLTMLQVGCCSICNEPRKLVVDHDHKTGAWRGLICGNCNTAIGCAADSPAVLRSAASYLDQAGAR